MISTWGSFSFSGRGTLGSTARLSLEEYSSQALQCCYDCHHYPVTDAVHHSPGHCHRVRRIAEMLRARRELSTRGASPKRLNCWQHSGKFKRGEYHRQRAGFSRCSILQGTDPELAVYVSGRKTGWPFERGDQMSKLRDRSIGMIVIESVRLMWGYQIDDIAVASSQIQ